MIEEHLAYWLAHPDDGTTSNATRQTARRNLRQRIGSHIYAGRRPPDNAQRSITLQRITSTRWNDVSGEDGIVRPVIQIDVWGRGSNAYHDVARIAELVRESLSGYRGTMDNSRQDSNFISGVAVVRDAMAIPAPPRDRQTKTGYTYHWSLDVEIVCTQTDV